MISYKVFLLTLFTGCVYVDGLRANEAKLEEKDLELDTTKKSAAKIAIKESKNDKTETESAGENRRQQNAIVARSNQEPADNGASPFIDADSKLNECLELARADAQKFSSTRKAMEKLSIPLTVTSNQTPSTQSQAQSTSNNEGDRQNNGSDEAGSQTENKKSDGSSEAKDNKSGEKATAFVQFRPSASETAPKEGDASGSAHQNSPTSTNNQENNEEAQKKQKQEKDFAECVAKALPKTNGQPELNDNTCSRIVQCKDPSKFKSSNSCLITVIVIASVVGLAVVGVVFMMVCKSKNNDDDEDDDDEDL